MSDAPDGGPSRPVTFTPGEALTAARLNQLQDDLLGRVLTHTHAGAEDGPQLSGSALLDGAIAGHHLAEASVGTAALQERSVTRTKLDDALAAELEHLAQQGSDQQEALQRLRDRVEEGLAGLAAALDAEEKRTLAHLHFEVKLLSERVDQLDGALRLRVDQEFALLNHFAKTAAGLQEAVEEERLELKAIAHQYQELARRPSTWGHIRLSHDLVIVEAQGHNVRDFKVVRALKTDVVQIRFQHRYRNHYTVIATAESDEFSGLSPVMPVVAGRNPGWVQISFPDAKPTWIPRDITLNFVIFGELAHGDSGTGGASGRLDGESTGESRG